MDWEKKIRSLFYLQMLLLVFVATALIQLDQQTAAHFRLYEILGALSASIITVFGLWKMKTLTE